MAQAGRMKNLLLGCGLTVIAVLLLIPIWRVIAQRPASTGAAGAKKPAAVPTPSPSPAPAQNQKGTPQPLVWYKIDARLSTDEQGHPNLLDGREQLTWLNDSSETIGELQFHLYLNAFKNQKSSFFRESGGELRGQKFESGEWGWIDLLAMRRIGGEDLTDRIEYIHPDDDSDPRAAGSAGQAG
jgi:hypothetical protein